MRAQDMLGVMVLLFPFWLVGCGLAGWAASGKGRSFAAWFMISMLASPLIALLAIIAAPPMEEDEVSPEERLDSARAAARTKRMEYETPQDTARSMGLKVDADGKIVV